MFRGLESEEVLIGVMIGAKQKTQSHDVAG